MKDRGGGVLGWGYTVLWVVASIHGSLAMYIYGFPVGIVIGVLVNWSVAAAEVLVSRSLWDNRDVMLSKGFSDGYIVFCALANSGIAIAQTIAMHHIMPAFPPVLFDVPFFLVVFTNFALGELAFTLGHRVMHDHFPHLHLFHHCCLYPSFTSNYLFDPLDLLIEFSLPGAIIYVMQVQSRALSPQR
jgi:hypothetical protein